MRTHLQRAALWLFWLYVGLYPESLILVALGWVPPWGLWVGSALLITQGVLMLAWLGGRYGGRGLAGGLVIGVLALLVEYVGATTGFPFGRYAYTDVLQPQLLGTVPLAICCAWLMVVPTAYQIADALLPPGRALGRLLGVATLVLALDLQIETVAANINGYWSWLEPGPYHGVPLANFAAWWVVGFGMGAVLLWVAGGPRAQGDWLAERWRGSPRAAVLLPAIPWLLYLMNTLMFTVINLARGYWLPGAVGLTVLAAAWAVTLGRPGGAAARPALRRRPD